MSHNHCDATLGLLNFYLIIFGVRAEPSNCDDPGCEIDLHDQPKPIAADVEDVTLADLVGFRIAVPDILKGLPRMFAAMSTRRRYEQQSSQNL